MKTSKSKTIVTTIILLAVLAQVPLFYYYAAPFSILIVVPYSLTGLLLTIFLLNSLINHPKTNTRYHIFGLIVALVIAWPTAYKQNAIEYWDWKLRMIDRLRIVEQIKLGVLKPDKNGVCVLTQHYWLPISNGKNEVTVTKVNDGSMEIEFYISGSLDHYSSLFYRDRKKAGLNSDGDIMRDLDANWYILHS